MLRIKTVFFMTFAISTASAALNPVQPDHHHHQHHEHDQQDEDCPICLEAPSSQQMMCENGHSMGCESCVEAIAAKASAEGVEAHCPMCRRTFDFAQLKAQAAPKVERDPEIQPLLIDREALIRQIIEQERQNLLADLGEVGLRQIRAEHLDALKQEVRNRITTGELFETREKERMAILQDVRREVRTQLIEQERQSLLNELGEEGRRQIRAEHLLALRQEVRNSFTEREVLEVQEQERIGIIREVRAELRRQQEAAIRQEQRALAQAGKLILINPLEQAQIEQEELHHMQGEERNRIRHVRRAQIISNRVQLISDAEKEDIMQDVFEQMQHAERVRKIEALNVRRKSIENQLYMKNGFIWLANWVPLMNIAYYNYVEDVDSQLRLQEANDPA